MNSVRGKKASISAAVCLAAILVAVPSAQAAVTSSSITTPTNNMYFLYDANNSNTFTVSGTTNGTTGDSVDINCYAGDEVDPVATASVQANGSFSTSFAPAGNANIYRVCRLAAVPHGSSPVGLGPYAGPRLLVGQTERDSVESGVNSGKLYDFYLYFQQPKGGLDYDSVGGCGIDDGYLLDTSNSLTTVTWYCNAWLNASEREAAPSRSEIQIDGVNAYAPASTYYINPDATPGFPIVSGYSYSQNSKTGNAVIHETDSFVKCPDQTYPPTDVTCPSFVSTGVSDARTIMQDHSGKVAWITDVFKNTTAHARKVDLLWQNDQHFYGSGTGGDAGLVEYKFPGQSGYSSHVVGDAVSLPGKPGKIFVRYTGAADGDTLYGRGAIVYDHAASGAKFMNLTQSQSDFTLHQVVTVPAHGSVRLRFAYIADFQQAAVNKLASTAATIYQGCTVPNVAGKTLAAAKSAIRRAHCAVGRVSHASSASVAAGHVISSKPKAKTHVDYHTKVALVVSRG